VQPDLFVEGGGLWLWLGLQFIGQQLGELFMFNQQTGFADAAYI